MNKIRLLIIGLVLIFLDLPIATAIRYPITHIKGEESMRSAMVEIFEMFMGRHFYIDIFSDIIGYGLLIAGLYSLRKYHKRFEMAAYGAVAGLFCSVSIMFVGYLPFEVADVVKAVAVIKAVDYLAVIIIVFSIARGLFAQVDGYKYLEMWNDFKYCWDVIAIAPPFIYLLALGSVISFPMTSELAMIFYGVWLYSGIRFVCHVYTYAKVTDAFGMENYTNE